ncbi:MAG: tetratricopeptide repeat protein [Lysobacteraceae bacterium]|nr:MAG: tetratricopeptide repeat protein [Xanthomonadaceae bacterium]
MRGTLWCKVSLLLVLLMPATAWPALAAGLPVAPAAVPSSSGPLPGLYADPDPAASALHAQPGQRAGFRQRLEATLRHNPRNSIALSHRAYLFAQAGDLERALRDYDAALQWAGDDPVYRRSVLWSRGWTRYNLGDTGLAMADWNQAGQMHGGRPYWLPYTLALGYWTLGEKALALQWFDAAVQSMPGWGQDAGFADKTRHWRPAQKAAMEGLFAAWKQRQAVAVAR